ncbi:MAG: ribokinase [Dehalococcoidia bacterium]|nr:ribokinase [Dehalococcoidia bacterium]MCB9486136.1 ribokinase [Thermoflexaceae bacterium]
MSAPPSITVLGSITLDVVLNMPRFPAPGETLFALDRGLYPGGKGLNQAVAAARLGARVTLLGRVGRDPFADILMAAADADGIDRSGVALSATGETGFAVPIVVAGGENAIFASPAANLEMTVDDLGPAERITTAGIFLTQFETPLDVVTEAIRQASSAGVPVLLNPAPVRPFDIELLRSVDILVVNEVEAGMLAPGLADDEARARALLALGPQSIVLTLGPAGGVWARGETAARFDAPTVEAIDTVGAGDGFCAALAVRLVEGAELGEAVRFAAAAAAISVTRPGAAPSYPLRADVEALMARE